MATRSIVGHGVSGAVMGCLYNVVGTAVLAKTGHDAFVGQTGTSAIEGLVGGAIVHGGLGLLAALTPTGPAATEAAGYAGSGLVAALTSGPTGSAVLSASHHLGQLLPVEALAAGATGLGVIAGGVLATAGVGLIVFGCCAGMTMGLRSLTGSLA